MSLQEPAALTIAESLTPPERDRIVNQYAKREHLLPVYARIRTLIMDYGPEVEIEPKRSYIAFRGRKVFALVKPINKSRLDLGLNLRAVQPRGRLEVAKGLHSSATHRVRLGGLSDIDQDVIDWLRLAYELP